jgi:hypothetical protein
MFAGMHEVRFLVQVMAFPSSPGQDDRRFPEASSLLSRAHTQTHLPGGVFITRFTRMQMGARTCSRRRGPRRWRVSNTHTHTHTHTHTQVHGDVAQGGGEHRPRLHAGSQPLRRALFLPPTCRCQLPRRPCARVLAPLRSGVGEGVGEREREIERERERARRRYHQPRRACCGVLARLLELVCAHARSRVGRDRRLFVACWQNDTVRTQIGSQSLKAVKTVKQHVEVHARARTHAHTRRLSNEYREAALGSCMAGHGPLPMAALPRERPAGLELADEGVYCS